ncbi:MAG: dethiobiotin synthase [Bacteroidales bacterium]|nr:dethiobiotin synthase [Bacteroidales bacterium]MBD5211619.1 dethiobiotin synthase [Bacteroidales bacterium]MBD5216973.1 dethiobiotin synthase [Bacteroidales bacterium]
MKSFLENLPSQLFVTGTGTDVGKSYATGWLAREIMRAGLSVITQKLIQTGNRDFSEDIEVHRKIMGIPYQTVDKLHITAPLILSYPCSPDLAAKIDNVSLDFSVADEATGQLTSAFSHVLIEGAGGIMVPLKGDWLQIDYVKERNLPAVVVTNGQLGSISHTLLTLLALREAGIRIYAVVYNPYFDKDKTIAADTRNYLKGYLSRHYQNTFYIEMPETL